MEFEGVEGKYYGIDDELYGLKKLIDVIGEIVAREENAFKDVENAARQSEEGYPNEDVLNIWHKKHYRQFTYRSTMLLIHTTFEDGIVRLYNILVTENRISNTVQKKTILDIIEGIKELDSEIPVLLSIVRGYNFIRNKVAHSGGYYQDASTDIDAFNSLVKGRKNIQIKKLTSPMGHFTHRRQITRSSILKDYLDVIGKIFTALLRGANKLKIIGTLPSGEPQSVEFATTQ